MRVSKWSTMFIVGVLLHSNILADGSQFENQLIEGKSLIQQAIDHWLEDDLVKARAHFNRLLFLQKSSWLIHYYLAYTDWRLVTFYNSQGDNKKANLYLDEGIQHLKKSIGQKGNFADSHALLSLLYGNKIGSNPLQGMILGPKSGAEMKKALEINKQNPRVWLLRGISAYYTPALFGGGKAKAKEYFTEAIGLFAEEKRTEATLPDWGHSESYAWLGLAELNLGNFKAAEANFLKALEIHPRNSWVRFKLLPEIEKQKGGTKKTN